MRLFAALRGEARETVSALLATNQDAQSIMNTLELHYDNKKLLVKKIVRDIKDLPDIDSGKIKLASFASKLKGACAALRSFKLMGHLDSPELIKCVGRKLPFFMRFTFDSYAATVIDDKTDLEKLADFLYRQTERSVFGGIFDLEADATVKKASIDKKALLAKPVRVYATAHQEAVNATSAEMSSSVSCVFCNRNNHISADCTSYARDSVERRWYLARKFRLCYKCLKQGHLKTDCENTNCTQCGRPHHTLLHNSSRRKFHNKNKNRNHRQYDNKNSQAAIVQVAGANETPKSPQ